MGSVESLTKILHGNWFSQGHIGNMASTGLAVGLTRKNSINFLTFASAADEEHDNQPTSGHAVGMIMHVGTNTQTVGTSEYDLVAIRSPDYLTTIVLLNISIPAGETGCFYSDTTLSEGVRKYFHYDGLGLHISKTGGTSASPGCTDIDMLIGLDNDSSQGLPEGESYTSNFN